MGVLYTLKNIKNPQLNCQPEVSKLRVVAKYMPKVEGWQEYNLTKEAI